MEEKNLIVIVDNFSDCLEDSGLKAIDRPLWQKVLFGTSLTLWDAATSLYRIKDRLTVTKIHVDRLDGVSFPCGSPCVGTAYASHPYDPKCLIPFGHYHEYLFQDKAAEFTKICATLGASKIQLVRDRNAETEKKVGLDVPHEVPLKAGVRVVNAKKDNFTLNMDFGAGRPPSQPKGVRWTEGEPLWKTFIDSRIQHGAVSLELSFSYENSFGVTADLAVRLDEYKIGIGGTFKYVDALNQTYRVTF